MITKSKVPQIRFKGFYEEWNSQVFDEIFLNISNNNLSRVELNYEFGKARNIHYGDILIKFNEILDVEKAIIPYITNSEYVNKFKNSKLQNGDIIIADAAEDETVGKCTEVVNIKDEIIFSGLHTIAVRPTKELASKYLGYYMNSSSYHNQLLPLLQGTKVLSISKSAIKNTDIDFPKDKNEQTKIGDYFQQLDKLIEQKEKKHQKLKQFKKASLSKMFPKNGADTPEIRFKGFSGKWEECKLEDNCSFFSGGTPTSTNKSYYRGNIPFIGSGKINSDKVEQYITVEALEKSSARLIIKGDLLYALYGATSGEVAISKMEGAINQAVLCIRTLQNKYFLFKWLLKNKKRILSTYLQGGQGNLSAQIIKNLNVKFPSLEEQEKIGNYFQKLDNQIELQLQEIEKLKNIKKASLNKMFV